MANWTLVYTKLTAPTMTEDTFFTDVQIARMLGYHPVTVRKWRSANTKAGCIKYGPPYEFRGPNVVYPKDQFRTWCAQVKVVNGVPKMNLPTSADLDVVEELQQSTANPEPVYAT